MDDGVGDADDAGNEDVDDAGDAASDVPAVRGEDGESSAAGGMNCPECGEALPESARFCPHCASAIDEDGEAVDLSEFDDSQLPGDPASLLIEDADGFRRASGKVRALSGLAVSVPLAPLILFLVATVVSLSIWTGALVFLGGWLLSAAILSRARVPAEAFGRSLYLIGVCTLLVPVALRVGQAGPTGGPTVDFEVVAAASLVIAVAALALGTFVTSQARKRVTGERRAFEDAREE